jgi:DNA-binding transcriptional LysR family regulator
MPEYYIKNHPEGITCFALPSHPSWEMCVCHKKTRYLSKATKYFIELVKEHWA